jgi:hypothetical protein
MTLSDAPNRTAPNTIVLVHSFWVTPRSWEKWVERYEGKGYRVLTTAYPGFEVEVEALREDPSFEGRSHYSVIGGEGWEEVADYALEWATEHATTRPAT